MVKLTQKIRRLFTIEWVTVFDYFVELVLKGLNENKSQRKPVFWHILRSVTLPVNLFSDKYTNKVSTLFLTLNFTIFMNFMILLANVQKRHIWARLLVVIDTSKIIIRDFHYRNYFKCKIENKYYDWSYLLHLMINIFSFNEVFSFHEVFLFM